MGGRAARALPDLLANFDAIEEKRDDRTVALFLDFDGTLSEIVERPETARLVDGVAELIDLLAAAGPVAIVSGRDRADVEARVGMPGLDYVGCHGLDIAGPPRRFEHPVGRTIRPALDRIERDLAPVIGSVPGSEVERKELSMAVHYRRAAAADVAVLRQGIEEALEGFDSLHLTHGKKVFEIRPTADWNKGRAVEWLLAAHGFPVARRLFPIYIGDDVTDEDGFAAVAGVGVGVLVTASGLASRQTRATYSLANPAAVVTFLGRLAEVLFPGSSDRDRFPPGGRSVAN